MKIAVVTGASSGMGRDFVMSIDSEFELDEIWVIARRKERLLELQSQCRSDIKPVSLDLAREESFKEYQALLEEKNPEIKVLVNAAGCGLFGTFTEMDMDGVNLNSEEDLVNVVKVVGDSVDGKVYSAIVKNENLNSPINIYYIKERLIRIISKSLQNIVYL